MNSRHDAFRHLAQLEQDEGELFRALEATRRDIAHVQAWLRTDPLLDDPSNGDPLLRDPSPVSWSGRDDRSAS